jgi:hypothetical protein
MTEQQTSKTNRRRARRQLPKASTKARCFKGSLGLGANLAVRVLDLSENGIRLVLRSNLTVGQEMEITLENVAARPVKALAEVVWSLPTADGQFAIGARFHKSINYGDFLALTRL